MLMLSPSFTSSRTEVQSVIVREVPPPPPSVSSWWMREETAGLC